MSAPKKIAGAGLTASGSVAIEYGLILPAMLLFTLGIMDTGRLLWANITLTRATEAAARCYAVNTTLCPAGSVPAYAANQAWGINDIAASDFVASTPACGRQVQATYTFQFLVPWFPQFRFGAIRRHNDDAERDRVLPESNLMAARDRRAELPAGPAAGDIVMSRQPEVSAGQLDDTARERAGRTPDLAQAERKPPEEILGDEGTVFRSLVEQEIAGIYIIAADGTLAYVNPYFARVFGYEPAGVVGRPMLEFVAEPERAAVSERFVAQMTGREPFSKFYSTLLRKDGAPVDVLIHSNVATFGGQQVSIGVILDIDKDKQEAERLREEEAKFRSLVEQNIAGIVIVHEDGTIGFCNGYFAHLVGYAREEVVGRPLMGFIPETEQPIVARSLRSQLFETGAAVQIASTVRARDGSIRSVLVNASKATFEGRSASIAVIVDVTERNAAQRKLASTAAILAAEHELTLDGILVVDPMARVISVNRRFAQIFAIPDELLAAGDDERVLALVSQGMMDAEAFQRRVRYLYDHPEETSQDELVLKNGHVLDRYSSPIKNSDGEYLGRIWFLRDITERRKAEEFAASQRGALPPANRGGARRNPALRLRPKPLRRREQGRRTPVRRCAEPNPRTRTPAFLPAAAA